MRRIVRSLLLATALTGVWGAAGAQAEPVSLFLLGVGAGFGGAAAGGLATGAIAAGLAAGQFLAANIGTLILVGVTLAVNAFNSTPKRQSEVNVRLEAGIRWHHIGWNKVGGNCIFASYAPDGALWYVIKHSDSELVELDHYRLDDMEVTVDGSNIVQTDAFKADVKFLWVLPGGRYPYYRIWTRTHTPSNPVPPRVTEFDAAFPAWTTDHKLVGCTFSVVKIDPVGDDTKSQIYKWRQGPLGLGEPGLTIVGKWGRAYDPRDVAQDVEDRSTWDSTSNPALAAAWWRTHPFGWNQSADTINWDKVGEAADVADVTWENKYGEDLKQYECGCAFPEDKANIACEQEILMACDGQVFEDGEGKWYLDAGHWEEPDFTITRQRDILTMASRDTEDGESETDGVRVTYTDAALGYIEQPCAAWINEDFYTPGTIPRYLDVKIESIRHHSQAALMAKIIGRRSQPLRKLGPTIGARALLARRKRLLHLEYDAGLTGDYQIVVPIELDPSLRTGVLGLVPVAENDWTLMEGEEGDRPRRDLVDNDDDLPLAQDVDIEAETVLGSGGSVVRIHATFDAPTSPIYAYEFEYSADAGTTWEVMAVDMAALSARSPILPDGETYEVRWRTVTSGGNFSDWSTPVEVDAVADTTSPGALTGVSVVGHLGWGEVDYTTPASGNVSKVAIYRAPTGVTLDRVTHIIETTDVLIGQPKEYIDGDDTVVDLVVNGTMAADVSWTKGTGWTIAAGVATHAAGTGSRLEQAYALAATTHRWALDMTARTAGTANVRLHNSGTGLGNIGSNMAAVGSYYGTVGNTNSANTIAISCGAAFAGSVDNFRLYVPTGSSLAQGVYDYYAEPLNGSNVAGTLSGPHTVTIV